MIDRTILTVNEAALLNLLIKTQNFILRQLVNRGGLPEDGTEAPKVVPVSSVMLMDYYPKFGGNIAGIEEAIKSLNMPRLLSTITLDGELEKNIRILNGYMEAIPDVEYDGDPMQTENIVITSDLYKEDRVIVFALDDAVFESTIYTSAEKRVFN